MNANKHETKKIISVNRGRLTYQEIFLTLHFRLVRVMVLVTHFSAAAMASNLAFHRYFCYTNYDGFQYLNHLNTNNTLRPYHS